jgi:ankyrin repeat protein
MALNYLLAWQPDVNIQDNNGLTPLHLAIKSADTMTSTRVVRSLLLRGAKTDIRDKHGMLAIDYDKEVKN